MRPKIIIFDFDGVICDSVHLKTDAFVELYSGYDIFIQEAVRQYHLENGGISRFEKIRYFQKELLGLTVSEETVSLLANKFALLVKEKVIASGYINGAKAFLEKHALSCEQYICTGTPEFEITEIIKRKGLTKLFKALYGSPKSKVEIIHKILGETVNNTWDCVFFGDAMTDYKAAVECKISFIGLKNPDTVFPEGTLVIEDFNDTKLEQFDL